MGTTESKDLKETKKESGSLEIILEKTLVTKKTSLVIEIINQNKD